MAEEVEMIPVDGAEPPKATLSGIAPAIQKPTAGATASTLKPGLKLPPKPGLKLPPKPGAGATVSALRPGVKLPSKPVIRKPGATVTAAPLPKPVAPIAKPVAVDSQGVGKLPTVEAKAVDRDSAAAPAASDTPKPIEALKSVTQKLKGITQEIPQQAILRKTGIIAEGAMSEAQKEAAKHKTARISLSDAMGVAPVKNDGAPMKTIRIKRPVDIGAPAAAPTAPTAAATPAAAPSPSVTQRKTLKITRPSGASVRPSGKFGKPAGQAAPAASQPAASAPDAVADIPDIPNMSMAPVPNARAADNGSSFAWTLSALVQLAACAAIGTLAWLLYQNSITNYF